jgi:hypothetical protein
MALISRREYARRRGVSEKAVRKAIEAGKIPVVDGMIDPEIADAAWIRNRDAGQDSKLAEAVQSLAQAPAAAPPVSSAAPEQQQIAERQQPAFELAPLTAARIRATEESAAIKEITRRRLEGGLLEAEEVDRTWGEILQVFKDRLRMIQDDDDVVDALVATNQRSEVRSILTRAVLSALDAMSKGVEGMAA